MRTVLELLLAFLVAILVPMGVCEAVFGLGIRSGEMICGHNAWIQIFGLLILGIIVVGIRAANRHTESRNQNSSGAP